MKPAGKESELTWGTGYLLGLLGCPAAGEGHDGVRRGSDELCHWEMSHVSPRYNTCIPSPLQPQAVAFQRCVGYQCD